MSAVTEKHNNKILLSVRHPHRKYTREIGHNTVRLALCNRRLLKRPLHSIVFSPAEMTKSFKKFDG
jgi:hypothetical protein